LELLRKGCNRCCRFILAPAVVSLQDVSCAFHCCYKRRVELCYRHLAAIWAELRVAAACVVSLLLCHHLWRLLQGCLHAAAVVALLLCLRALLRTARSC
jgi:hypothetical protein